MATYTGERIKDTYESIVKLEDNAALTGSPKRLTDGLGNPMPLSLSDTEVKASVNVEATGFKTPTGTSLEVLLADGTTGSVLAMGDLNMVHNQNVASASWVINHNLNKYPNAVVIDSAGTNVTGEITYTNINTITINFTGGFSGTAYIN